MRTIKHEIPGATNELARTLPKGLKWELVGSSLEVKVPRWPDNNATRFHNWCLRKGVHIPGACNF